MARKHKFQATWRSILWEDGIGIQLKRINKLWVIKKHFNE